jgi:hypothetical protein
MRKAVLYAQDTPLTRRIVVQLEADPSWELIALCTTPADLNFVLDRVPIDVLLLPHTPGTADPPAATDLAVRVPTPKQELTAKHASLYREKGRPPCPPCWIVQYRDQTETATPAG